MAQYRVTWESNWTPTRPKTPRVSPRLMRDPDSIATVFTSRPGHRDTTESTPANTRRQTMSAKVQEIVIDLDDRESPVAAAPPTGCRLTRVVVRGAVVRTRPADRDPVAQGRASCGCRSGSRPKTRRVCIQGRRSRRGWPGQGGVMTRQHGARLHRRTQAPSTTPNSRTSSTGPDEDPRRGTVLIVENWAMTSTGARWLTGSPPAARGRA